MGQKAQQTPRIQEEHGTIRGKGDLSQSLSLKEAF